MARHRKDPADRQRSTPPPQLHVEAGTQEPAPSPPPGLLARTRRAWEDFWTSRYAGVVDRTTDLPDLRELFTLYDERDRYRQAVKGKTLVRGSTGQIVLNPLLRRLPIINGEIRHLQDRFGITPRARRDLGAVFDGEGGSLDDLNDAVDKAIPDLGDPRLEILEGTDDNLRAAQP